MKNEETIPDIDALAHILSSMGPLRLRDDRGGKYKIFRYINAAGDTKTVVRGLHDAEEVHEWMLNNGKFLMECVRDYFTPYLDRID